MIIPVIPRSKRLCYGILSAIQNIFKMFVWSTEPTIIIVAVKTDNISCYNVHRAKLSINWFKIIILTIKNSFAVSVKNLQPCVIIVF